MIDHAYHDRIREASELASEAMALIESIGDPNLTVGLSVPVIYAKTESGERSDLLRWTQTGHRPRRRRPVERRPAFRVVRWRSPMRSRAIARYCLGRPGWRDDLRHGLAMARSADPLSYAATVA